jgi:hypothetical protein
LSTSIRANVAQYYIPLRGAISVSDRTGASTTAGITAGEYVLTFIGTASAICSSAFQFEMNYRNK